EQGPIRPPSEAGSLLLRFTRNCPWNRCSFCPVYKGQRFSRRSLEEIKNDIDSVVAIIEDLQRLSYSLGFGGRMTQPLLSTVLSRPSYGSVYHYVAYWHISGNGRVFIQDANSLILPNDILAEAIFYLRKRVPGITRVTSYGRSSTLARKSRQEMRTLAEAGLDRIHIGLESGANEVLHFVKKGTTAEEHILAGRKVIEAGITLSEYIMPGLGGRQWSSEHATETARVLNAIDPHFIRLRSLRIPPRTPLYQDVVDGRFTPLSDDDTAEEILLLLDSLNGIHSSLTSDHIMNLLPEVEGTFPRDKERMIGVVKRYLALSGEERLIYRLGRRGGAVQSLDDLGDPCLRIRLETARKDLEAQLGGDLEKLITELGDQYI
ncbi:MAG: radical SAM protein, partial [Deltaproteobacteria bacterium]|nr:radical SAM protein [Deltaproteobacteria bacterium]